MLLKQWVGTVGVAAIVAGTSTGFAEEKAVWTDRIRLKGDLRLRHEIIDQDARDTRNRTRLRARLSLQGMVNDEVDVHLRLASGSDDPVSTNQSLDGGFSSKDINLDRAYIAWTPVAVRGLTLWGGKTPMPFKSVKDLVWDSDLNPEGLALKVDAGSDDFGVFVNAAFWWAEERSTADDTLMIGGQIGANLKASDSLQMLAGASYFLWDNTKGFDPLFDTGDGFGNTVVEVGEDGDLVYANEYGVFELFYKVGIKAAMPISLYGDYILNTEADTNDDTGFLFGVKVGKAKKQGTYELDYNYRDLEADATIGAFTDSDSFGGGTNGDGHKISGKYQLTKSVQAGIAVFLNSIDPGGRDLDYTRAQFDVIAKF